MKVFKSMRARLSIIFVFVSIILILLLSLIIGQRSINEVQNEIGNSLGEVAFITGEILDQYMWSRYGEVATLSQLTALREPENLEEIENLINHLQDNIPSFSWIGFTDKDGVVLASTDGILRGVDISARPVYTEAQTTTFIGDVHEAVLLAELLPNPTGEPMKFVDISTPIFDSNNQFIGVLAAHLSWEWVKEVEESMLNTLQNRSNIEFIIVSKQDDHVLLGPAEMIGHVLNVNSVELAKEHQHGWVLETWDDHQYLTGYVLTEGYKNYPGLGWTILVRQPLEAAYAPAQKLLHDLISYALVLILLFAVLGWFLAGQVTRPLNEITKVANKIKEGENVEVPKYKGINEIEILSDSLRNLLAALSKTETALVKMEDVAHHDQLTGLPNRHALTAYFEKVIHKYNTLTILYLDLDGFKKVNDQWGHDTGDQLLKEVSQRLKQNVRNEEFISRIGGDEFMIVLTNENAPIKNGTIVGERIISMVNEPYYIDEHSISVGCTIGGAIWHCEGNSTMGEVIQLADQAVYHAKRSGKNRIYFTE
ncbi:diguanylate cyclase/phosphodiesterase [Halalkalibacter wakoensis JCM 9140]|uniref:Diguanylate cyclase/phosphodiesterase n=1 Tax=Halalkalibacter wakoensis JCM 9140 TaxID=1236970 RepID=W4Q8A4_9BACI|nr:diguanylate cyclase [Halalkalibacter wakoensis]GAE28210.1 diguanylate cyclase/phosphodiesterase [Halalkalibacter wakoensis JCM 9140]